MICFAVIDTNVIVSAAIKPDSIPGKILALALSGEIRPVFSREILLEYKKVLSRAKFCFEKSYVDNVIKTFNIFGDNIVPLRLSAHFEDADDKKFYEAFVSLKDERDVYLVTGNIRHFPNDERIVTPRQMTDILKASPGRTWGIDFGKSL